MHVGRVQVEPRAVRHVYAHCLLEILRPPVTAQQQCGACRGLDRVDDQAVAVLAVEDGQMVSVTCDSGDSRTPGPRSRSEWPAAPAP